MDEIKIMRALVTQSRTENKCRLWTGMSTGAGYGQLYVPAPEDPHAYRGRHVWYSHRLAYLLFKGPIPYGMSVCHTCDTPSCINPDHLWLGTQADNNRDAFSKGHWAIGSRHRSAKLSEQDIIDIRALASNGSMTQRELATHFHVAQQSISKIVSRKRWRHVSP